MSTTTCLSPSFQVVDLLNQAALVTSESKITLLKQVRGRSVAGQAGHGEGHGKP